MKPIKMRTAGATPVEKWINIVKKWNSCDMMDDANILSHEYICQRMLICMTEARELVNQYPEMKKDVKAFDELDHFQIECLKYSNYFYFEYPSDMIQPIVIGSYKLLPD